MKYILLNKPDSSYSAIEQILVNRGIPIKEVYHYINTTDNDINTPDAFGSNYMHSALALLATAVAENKRTLIIVDADCDGFTSAALLINYLNDIFPAFVNNDVEWLLHSGKQHGLSDCIEIAKQYDFVILPDSSSNDYEYHKTLWENNIDVLVLDHHEAEKISDYACVVNNQLTDYPNKELSGVGVTWQFCRYMDRCMKKDFANKYLDLVALGLMADMMSMISFETKHLINKGFKAENIKNPFIFEMWQKNKFKLGEEITPMGAAFYIAPFVNAMVRSGEPEEKELLFNSMLNIKAFDYIPSNKRGHKPGETERLVDQAIRTCTNVKNRQTRAQDAGMEILETMIENDNLLDHKVLLFLMQPGQIDRNIAGLCANKIMAKYQRPCCILTKVVDEDVKISYQGSARGYEKSGIKSFKDICENTGVVMYAQGHSNAFGIGILESDINTFIEKTDDMLENISSEPIYYVDYIFTPDEVDGDKIVTIADMANYWGKDVDEALIAIKGLTITDKNFQIMKSNTLKLTLPNGIGIIKFGGTEEDIKTFTVGEGYKEIDIICKCNKNEWMGRISPQLFLEDYEVVDSCAYYF